jgi:uncharacterized membrane protein YbhN (UPF0104 family)
VIIVLLVEDTVPFSVLLMASPPVVTSASAAAPSASVSTPSIRVWLTRRAGSLVLRIALRAKIFLGVFAV